MTQINVAQTIQPKITVLEKSDWLTLVSNIRNVIAGNSGISNAEIEKSIMASNPNYASKLIDLATNTARNYHQGYLEYLAAMQPLNYGDETLEASVLNYLTGTLQIKYSIAKAALLEGRAELKKMAFDLLKKAAKDAVKPEDINVKPTKIAARINDECYEGELSERLFNMLVVAVDAHQSILREAWLAQSQEEQRLQAEQDAADEKIRKERAAVAAAARAAEVEAKAIAKAKKDAEKAKRIEEFLTRQRVKFAMAGRTFYAFNVSQEEAFLLDDGTFCITGDEFFKVNKNPKSGRTSTTTLVGAERIDQMEKSSTTEDATGTPGSFRLEKAQAVWVVYKDRLNRQQVVKATVIPVNHANNLTVDDDDNGLLIVNNANGGPLHRKTASAYFQIGICRPATREEKTAAKKHDLSKAA